ncbi:MAG: nuclear transport factor 2 family protein [Kofleriaceae bacterium]
MRPADVARASFDAYVLKDRDAIEKLLAEEFTFTSPMDNQLDRETYLLHCWPNSEIIDRFEFLRVFDEGDTVIVTYVGHTTDNKKFRNTEVFTVRGNQIVEIEVYFGWDIPHAAPSGGFSNPSPTRRARTNF